MKFESSRPVCPANAESLAILCRLMDAIAEQFSRAEISQDSSARDVALASLRMVAKEIDALSVHQLTEYVGVLPSPNDPAVSKSSMT